MSNDTSIPRALLMRQ